MARSSRAAHPHPTVNSVSLCSMQGNQIEIAVDGRVVTTLRDILPDSGRLKMLIVAKTPAPLSVAAGHYFQGKQGQMFWSALVGRGLLNVPTGAYHDDHLLAHGYGITDVVKVPRPFGDEPSDDEYRAGIDRVLGLIKTFQPTVLMFVYKGVLDAILRLRFGIKQKAQYGFNTALDHHFGTRTFAFPMPGTPCRREVAQSAMADLHRAILRGA